MAKCDICGITCKAYEMRELLESYKTDGVSDLCGACEKKLTDYKWELVGAIDKQMKARVKEMKAKFEQPTRFARFFSRRGL